MYVCARVLVCVITCVCACARVRACMFLDLCVCTRLYVSASVWVYMLMSEFIFLCVRERDKKECGDRVSL